MSIDVEWFRQQSEYNKRVYERLQADHRDMADWKVTVLFYSGLHRINYWLGTQTGRVPSSHVERKRRVKSELPRAIYDYNSLYLMSRRARYCEGFRIGDDSRRHAAGLLDRLERSIPFDDR